MQVEFVKKWILSYPKTNLLHFDGYTKLAAEMLAGILSFYHKFITRDHFALLEIR